MPDLLYMSCQDCHVQKIWSGFMFRPDFLHVGVQPGRTWILFRLCFLHMGVQPCTRLPAQRSPAWQDMLLLFVQIRLPAHRSPAWQDMELFVQIRLPAHGSPAWQDMLYYVQIRLPTRLPAHRSPAWQDMDCVQTTLPAHGSPAWQDMLYVHTLSIFSAAHSGSPAWQDTNKCCMSRQVITSKYSKRGRSGLTTMCPAWLDTSEGSMSRLITSKYSRSGLGQPKGLTLN